MLQWHVVWLASYIMSRFYDSYICFSIQNRKADIWYSVYESLKTFNEPISHSGCTYRTTPAVMYTCGPLDVTHTRNAMVVFVWLLSHWKGIYSFAHANCIIATSRRYLQLLHSKVVWQEREADRTGIGWAKNIAGASVSITEPCEESIDGPASMTQALAALDEHVAWLSCIRHRLRQMLKR